MDRPADRTVPPMARTPTLLMLLAFAVAAALHLGRVPAWYIGTVAGSLLWYWLHYVGRSRLPPPNRWVRYVLVAGMLALVLLSFGTVNGLRAGTGLLLVMGALKLQETRTPRDAVVVATSALILVLAAALDRQDLWRLPLYLLAAWLALGSITSLGSVQAQHSKWTAMRRAGAAMLMAVPFAILAFVLVPRLPGALWAMPGGERAQTGLSDEMSPGGISDLAISDAIAFRARFEGTAPPPAERYWRGPVLHDFDGNTWRAARFPDNTDRTTRYLSPPLRYEVTLEPHQNAWLFTIDTGVALEGRHHFRTSAGEFRAHAPVVAPLTYRAVSHVRTRNAGELSAQARNHDTALPAGRNLRSQELARTLRAQADSDADYARRVMRYFADNGFEYTLTPPQLDFNSVDDLLFNTRLGFCGHFASAYATLMRAAGVPARVVTGYLGGTWNGIGGYYVVRQSDAHAWTEVWLDGEGWVRFDPTGMVAPQRLQRGLNEILAGVRQAEGGAAGQQGWLLDLRDAWDAAGSWWRERVVGFNGAKQRALLAKLGLDGIDYRGMALLLLAGAMLWAVLLLAFMKPRPAGPRPDAVGRMWNRYLALLDRRGLAVAEHEGPEAIRRRAQRTWPHARDAIEGFTRSYTAARFGTSPAGPAHVADMRARLRGVERAVLTPAR